MYLALTAGGWSDINLQHLLLTLRNRTIHKCDVSNVCTALDTTVELISLKDEDGINRVEHYPSPDVDSQLKTYTIWLVKHIMFMNDIS